MQTPVIQKNDVTKLRSRKSLASELLLLVNITCVITSQLVVTTAAGSADSMHINLLTAAVAWHDKAHRKMPRHQDAREDHTPVLKLGGITDGSITQQKPLPCRCTVIF